MIKIWGRTDSSNVQKVLWCCGELGLPFERLDWGGKFGGNQDPQYTAMNPNGLVPTIKDGDFVLWESNSIMRYLNAKYGNGKLLPASPEGMANANRWMDWQLSAFNPVIVPLFFATVRTAPEKRDPKAIQSGTGQRPSKPGKQSTITWRSTVSSAATSFLSAIFRWVFGPTAGSICPSTAPNKRISSAGTKAQAT